MAQTHEWLDGVAVESSEDGRPEPRHHGCLEAAPYRPILGSMVIVGEEGNIGGMPEGDIVGVRTFTCGACGEPVSTYHGETPPPAA